MSGLLDRTPRATADGAPAWMPASPDRPCPVCGGTHGCAEARTEGLACCCAAVSTRPVAGGGWLHVLAPG